MKKQLTALFSVIILLTLGCEEKKETEKFTSLTPDQYAEVRYAIVPYMECEECEDGELENVLKLGEQVAPTLKAILHKGPSPAKKEEYAFFWFHLIRGW